MKSKLFFLPILIIMACLTGFVPAAHAATIGPTISLSATYDEAGDPIGEGNLWVNADSGMGEEFYIWVNIDDATDVAGAALTVNFDSAYFEVAETDSNGEFTPTDSIFNMALASENQTDAVGNKGETGKVLLSGAAIDENETSGGGGASTGAKTLFKVKFKVINGVEPGTPTIPFSLAQTQLFNTDAGWGYDDDGDGVYDPGDGDTMGTVDVLTSALSKDDGNFGGDLADDFGTISYGFDLDLPGPPVDSSYNIQGTITYDGSQPGDIYIGAFVNIGDDEPAEGTMIVAPGPYNIELDAGPYFIMAYKDVNGDPENNDGEPMGFYTTGSEPTAVTVGPDQSGIDFAIEDDLDTDEDGIHDDWELMNFGNLSTADATSDFDQDGYSDLDEYNNGTNPTEQDPPDGPGYDPATDDRVSTLSIDLVAGWNWVSFNGVPQSTDLATFFGINNQYIVEIKSQTKSAVNLLPVPGWVGNTDILTQISEGTMFKIKITQDFTLDFIGNIVPETTPINLVTGWNWIGYIPISPRPVGDVMGNIADPADAVEIKSQTESKVNITPGPGWVGTMTNMNPGVGYKLKMSTDSTLIYVAP